MSCTSAKRASSSSKKSTQNNNLKSPTGYIMVRGKLKPTYN
jgi:hypothetical protein